MARAKLARPEQPEQDLSGVGSLDDAKKASLSELCFQKLENAVAAGDLEQVKVAATTLAALSKTSDKREAPKLRADAKFVAAIDVMSRKEFSIPSRLKPMLNAMRAAEAAALDEADVPKATA